MARRYHRAEEEVFAWVNVALLYNLFEDLVAGARNHLNLRLLSTYRRILEQVAMADHRDLFRAAA